MYSVGLYLIQNTDMEFNVGDVLQLILILVSVGVVYGVVKTRQDSQEKRIDALEEMIKSQISVDNGIKDVLTELKVGQVQLSTEVKAVLDRLEKVEK
jgi:uncharacterized coiled-coil protein SlyX